MRPCPLSVRSVTGILFYKCVQDTETSWTIERADYTSSGGRLNNGDQQTGDDDYDDDDDVY